jgi:hypothetical protein
VSQKPALLFWQIFTRVSANQVTDKNSTAAAARGTPKNRQLRFDFLI